MSDDLSIEIDFTDVNAATGNKIGVLPAGLHTATIDEFKHYTDSGSVLYCYMDTDGVRHRERFNLDNAKAYPFLKAFLLSAGMPKKALAGAAQVPFNKLAGKTVRFNYSPPDLDENGAPIKGTYASYTFYDKKRFAKLSEVMKPATVSSGAPTSAASGSGDFDFLIDE